MSEQNPAVESATVSPPKKVAKVPSTKKPKAAPKPKTHPPVSEMVIAAVKTLKERGGSSLQAIKKYLAANYKVDCGKLAPFIKKFLKNAVANGQLLQTKGKGASGSFKLPVPSKKDSAEKKKVVKAKTPKSPSKVKKISAKKPSVAKSAKKSGSPTKIKKPVAKKLAEKKAVAKAPIKKAAIVKKPAVVKKAAPVKKAVPAKKAAPAKKASPAKRPAAAKKAAAK